MEPFDVLIIGGGPAGLSAGIAAAGCGLRTLVLEGQTYPVDKACGEGVMPTGVAHLERLGVAKHLPEGRYFPFPGIQYVSPKGRQARGIFREGPGWGVRRTELSAAFLARTGEMECLEVRSPCRVMGIERGKDRVAVQTADGAMSARLVVGADGLRSNVRRWSGLEGPPRPARRWGARQHFAIPPWNDAVEIWWGDGIEAYVTPCSESLTGVAFLWDRTRFHARRGGGELISSLLPSFPRLQKRLDGAAPASRMLAMGPMAQSARAVATDGIVLVGDAAGYLDAITGDGISLATTQALALGGTVFAALASRPPSASLITAEEMAAYSAEFRRIVDPYYQMTRLVLALAEQPVLIDAVVRLLDRRPRLFQHLLSANIGAVPLWPGLLKSFSFVRP